MSSRTLALVVLSTSILLMLGVLVYYFLIPKIQPQKLPQSQQTAKTQKPAENVAAKPIHKCTDIQMEPLAKNIRIVIFKGQEKVLGEYEGQIKNLSVNDKTQKATFKLADKDKETKIFEVEEKEKLPFTVLKNNLDVILFFECLPSNVNPAQPQISYYKIAIK